MEKYFQIVILNAFPGLARNFYANFANWREFGNPCPLPSDGRGEAGDGFSYLDADRTSDGATKKNWWVGSPHPGPLPTMGEGETLPASFKIRAGWIKRVGSSGSFSGNAIVERLAVGGLAALTPALSTPTGFCTFLQKMAGARRLC